MMWLTLDLGAYTLAIQGNVDVFCFQQLGNADCVVGFKSHGVNSLEDLKGKRLGMLLEHLLKRSLKEPSSLSA